ncbi:hypothetical protein AKJ16_DCAP20799 [Drosera capensis]
MKLGHEEYMAEPAKVGPRLMLDNFDREIVCRLQVYRVLYKLLKPRHLRVDRRLGIASVTILLRSTVERPDARGSEAIHLQPF